MPPSLLAFARLVIGAAVLIPFARWMEPAGRPVGRGDAWRMVWMGIFGFAGASAFSHWGLARSTATNGALLIIVEPVAIMLLGPVVLGERLTRREAAGAALAVLGAAIVVINGVPGVTQTLAPHWRGDLLLVLSGLGYASYSLIGRDVLARHSATSVTARSIMWGAVAMVPLAAIEWQSGSRPSLGPNALVGILYLGLVITALGYLIWNWALTRTGRLARGDLRHGAADRWRAAGLGAAPRAHDGVHAGRRRAHRGGTLVDRHRPKLTVY